MSILTKPNSAAGNKAVAIALKKILAVMKPAKAFSLLNQLNQHKGIDCPGCAWPDPDTRSKLGEYCENGVKAIAEEATDKKASPDFFNQYSVSEMLTKDDYWLGQQGRLVHPMLIREGEQHYKAISWKDAFALIGKELNDLASPDEAIFYTSGRTSNEAAFLYQLFVRMYGTNNMPDCSNMCHESSGVGLTETLGIGKGSVSLEDFDKAELIMVFGQNPGTNHPRMLSALEKSKKKGAKVISVNPLKEVGLERFKNPQNIQGVIGSGTKITDLYLQVKINEDVALLKAIMIKLLQKQREGEPVFDTEFIENKTFGYQLLIEDLSTSNLGDLISRTGLKESQIDEAVTLLAKRKRIIICWAMGLTQHVNGVDNIREIVNLLLLKGSIGKPGSGTCPVRGHSNVQGDRTMGIVERPSKALIDNLAENFDFEPPQHSGYNVVESIEAMYSGKAKVFIAMGGNFFSATPDTDYTTIAMQNCRLTVHVSTKLNRSHLVHGKMALILPCLGRTDKHIESEGEQLISVENSMGIVHSSQGMLKPLSRDLLSEPAIVAGIAKATIKQSKIDWDYLIADYSRIRDLIGNTIPGFENFNDRLKKDNGFYLPNGARNGEFNTENGKAVFTINRLAEQKLAKGEYLLTTVRSHDQFNTTIYGLDDRYRGVFNERKVVFMNPVDIQKEHLHKGDMVSLFSMYDGVEREVHGFKVVPYDIPEGCIASYFPETNVLVPLSLHARGSFTPASKSIVIRLRK